MSGLKWTHKTTRKIADELKGIGINVSKDTVAALLKELKFALRVNHKKISNGRYTTRAAKEKRNLQFEYIKQLKKESAQQGDLG